MQTEVYPDRRSWLAARLGSTGGSEISNLLAVPVDGREPRGLWWEWVRKNPAAWSSLSEAERGRWLDTNDAWRASVNVGARRLMESVVEGWARDLLEKEGLEVRDPGDFAIVRKPSDPRAHYSPDGLIYPAGEEAGAVADASYKTARERAAQFWPAKEPSEYAFYQAQWGLYVMGLESARIFLHIGFGDTERERIPYTVERDDEVISLLQEANERFWGWVDADTPPPVDGLARTTLAIRLYYRRSKARARVVLLPPKAGWTNPETGKFETYAKVCAGIARAERKLEEWGRRRELGRQALELALGEGGEDAGELVVASPRGEPVVYRRSLISRSVRKCACGETITAAGEYVSFRRKEQPKRG